MIDRTAMRRSMKTPLFWVGTGAALVVLAVVSFAAFTSLTTRERTLDNEIANLRQMSLPLAEHAHRIFFGADLLASSIEERMIEAGVQTPEAFRQRGSTPEMHRTLHEAVSLTADVDAISLADTEGRIINTSRAWPVPDLSIADRDYFIALRDHAGTPLVISAPLKNRLTGQESIFLVRRVSAADGRFLGVVAASISTSRLTRLFGAILRGGGDSVALARRDGTLLVREPAADGVAGLPQELVRFTQAVLARSEEGTLHSTSTGPGGTRELVALHTVRGYPLAVLASNPESAVLQEWWQLARLILFSTLGAALLVLALGHTVARQWRLQLEVLETAKLRQLNQELQATVAEREQAEQALQRAYGENRAVTEAVTDSLFMLDLAGRLVWWNRRVEQSTGRTPQQLRGANALEFFHERDRAAVAEAMARVMSEGLAVVEGRLLTVDGPVDHQFNAVRVLDAQGQLLGIASSGRDISKRKRGEEALRRLNEDLEARVAQRTHQLLAAKDEAERANLAKSDFLSRMSHELRTPMNAVLGFAQLLELDNSHPLTQSQLGYARHIRDAGDHLLELINDVLDLARVESGKLSIKLEPVRLSELIEECLTLVRDPARARGIQLRLPTSDCSVLVRADRIRLKQVLLNLLSNAVKYNREQGSVALACAADGKTMRVSVTDTGPGLAPEQLARLFVPFERLGADKVSVEGTGIGLALSKHLTHLMGGEIGVQSTPGTGSTFWIDLPLELGAAQTTASHDGPGAGVAAPPASPRARRPAKVLCIEDNAANLALIEQILARRDGTQLFSAANALLGLELARRHAPDVILLDISLPGMDGWSAMAQLQADDSTRGIPVVAISANAMPRDLERGRTAGFAAYLTKPLDIEQLDRVLDALLASA